MSEDSSIIESDIRKGKRFSFGKNWQNFLKRLDNRNIEEAERSLSEMLETKSFQGLTFLDVGSGSGLFSLAARRLGANVVSFDYDPSSVQCTAGLRNRFFPDDKNWTVKQGSVLDKDFLQPLGKFDIVYSWGVLHHTGNMWRALDLVIDLLKPGGRLFIAIYNNQGRKSRLWRQVKKFYCRLPKILKPMMLCFYLFYKILRHLFAGSLMTFWSKYYQSRGMSPFYDAIDWLGGYPYEVALPDEIIEFYRQRNFRLCRLKTAGGGLGCNEFVFQLEGKV